MDAVEATYAGNQMMAAEKNSWHEHTDNIGLDIEYIIGCHCLTVHYRFCNDKMPTQDTHSLLINLSLEKKTLCP